MYEIYNSALSIEQIDKAVKDAFNFFSEKGEKEQTNEKIEALINNNYTNNLKANLVIKELYINTPGSINNITKNSEGIYKLTIVNSEGDVIAKYESANSDSFIVLLSNTDIIGYAIIDWSRVEGDYLYNENAVLTNLCFNLDYSPNIKNSITYTTSPKVNKVIKELYINGTDEYYISVIRKKYSDDNITNQCQIQIRNTNNDIVCEYQDYIEGHEPSNIIYLKGTNVYGYAIVNWNEFESEWFHYLKDGKAVLTSLCLDNSLSPTIYSYLNKSPKFFKNTNFDIHFKEFYAEGLDENTTYFLRTFNKNEAGKFNVYIGKSDGTYIACTNNSENEGVREFIEGNTKIRFILQRLDEYSMNIFGNTNSTIGTLDKEICCNIDNSPIISNYIQDQNISSISNRVSVLEGEHYTTKITNGQYPYHKENLRILAIGNSFTVDGTTYLKRLLENIQVDISKITLTRLIHGSSTFDTWIEHIENNSSFGTATAPYCEAVIGNITDTTIQGILSKGWDIVVIHQSSEKAGDYSTFNNCVKYINLLRQYTENPNLCIYYNIPYGHSNNGVFGYDDWKNYVNVTQNVINDIGIDKIIPTGTAIQKARNTELTYGGQYNNLTRDNWHLNSGTGRYIAACTWYEALLEPYFEISISSSTLDILETENSDNEIFIDSFVAVNNQNRLLCNQCAMQSVEDFSSDDVGWSKIKTNYANKEGTYPNLTSGFADNLVGRGEATPEVFTFRQSGGNTSINDGTARLKSIKGNSAVFNQLFLRGANSNYYQWEDSKVTINGTITSDYETYDTEGNGAIYSLANDHILLVTIKQLSGKVTNGEVQIRAASFGANKILTITPESSNAELSFIGKYLSSGKYYTRTKILANTTVDNLVLQYQIFDLTAMFGAGNEPQTVEEFKALYPNDYYEYNAGEIINSNYTAIESVGFNQWDEQWELGTFNNNGEAVTASANDTIRNKNYTRVLSDKAYYFNIPNPTNGTYMGFAYFYDTEKKYVGKKPIAGRVYSIVTTPSNCAYMRFVLKMEYGTTYKNDICINLSHTGYRNGEYEPYRKDVITLPNIELKKAGNVYDEIRYNPNSEKWEYVQRVITRAYEEGDSNKADVITDGVNTNVAVDTPIITELEGDYSTDYIVSDFGTEKAITDKLCAPFSVDIIYQFNAVDRIRENSAKIEELQAEDTNIKVKTLNLTVKDNGNIVLANADGVSQEFMPATPSGDPMHYMYEKCGAVWNGDTGYWELNGLTDMTTEDMQDSYLKCNMYSDILLAPAKYMNKLFRTNILGNISMAATVPAGPAQLVYRGDSALEILNFNFKPSGSEIPLYYFTNMDFCFYGCKALRSIRGSIKCTNASFTDAFKGCELLTNIKLLNVSKAISFADSPNLSRESLLYLINNAGTATFTITLHADTYAWASVDEDIQAALAIKTNITLQSA